MSAASTPTRTAAEPLYVPAAWQREAQPPRDVALDLLRGLAMVILVVNHTKLESALGHTTRALLSAAEVLVAVSGVVVGIVFGRRWLTDGARATSAMLLRRAGKLYVASVVVVALVGAATLIPGLGTDALRFSPNVAVPSDLYGFDGPVRTAAAVLTLEAGPWQFNILGFFVAGIALAPALLWALSRGWWKAVLAASWLVYAAARAWDLDVLPSQSERPFPILVWQVLFVNGVLLGWHRRRVAELWRRRRRALGGTLVAIAAACAALQVAAPLVDAQAWAAWKAEHFHKGSLDLLRILAMGSIAGSIYLGLRRHSALAERTVGRVLLPLGRNSFYVFIVHVFLCLALASVPFLAPGAGFGLVGNSLVQIGCVLLLAEMVRRRFLFRWIPR